MTDTPATDALLAANDHYAADFDRGGLPAPPASKLAVVTCMDARIDPPRAFGIDLGQAHIIRNAGGVVSDDVLRSLTLSQRALGTTEIVLIHHTKCGVQGLDDQALFDGIEAETGHRPTWPALGFDDAVADVRASMERLRAAPELPHTDGIRGFVYDVDSGRLEEVS